MSDPFEGKPFPRGAMIALVGLVLFSLAAVILARMGTETTIAEVNSAILDRRDLRFEDGGGGLVKVYDADEQELIQILQPGTENFIRGVLRGLARERRSKDLGETTPFRLERHHNHRLTLTDLATDRKIDLQAFGETNASAFADLLEANKVVATSAAW